MYSILLPLLGLLPRVPRDEWTTHGQNAFGGEVDSDAEALAQGDSDGDGATRDWDRSGSAAGMPDASWYLISHRPSLGPCAPFDLKAPILYGMSGLGCFGCAEPFLRNSIT